MSDDDVLRREQRRLHHAQRLRGYASRLTAVLRATETVDAAFVQAAALSAQALIVERTSVWMVDRARQALICRHLLVGGVPVSEALEFPLSAMPDYLAALAEVAAFDDVAADPRAHEIRGYCARHGIGALLDIPIFVDGELAGVVCHEHVGPARMWVDAEIDLATNVGHLVTLAIESSRRRELDARYRQLVETLPVVVYSFESATGALAYVGPAAEALCGYPADRFLGKTIEAWLELVVDEDRGPIRDRVRASGRGELAPEITYRIVRADGRIAWIRDLAAVIRDPSGRAIAVQGTLEDITAEIDARHRLREAERASRQLLELERDSALERSQLAEQRKLESLGRLAAGIAHDFNNALTALAIGLGRDIDKPALAAAFGHAKELVGSLLGYARREPIAPSAVDVDREITNLAPMLGAATGGELELVQVLEAAERTVWMPAIELRQLLVNLVTNAAEATRGHGHAIRIETLVRNDAIILSVSDDGRGMDRATIERAFEPFFTTKPVGAGTGIGLATCHAIVSRAGGSISVESKVGFGTAFRIALPLHDLQVTTSDEERLLLVEDNPALATLVARTLVEAGYRVESAVTVDDARAALARTRFDVVVASAHTDVIVESTRARHPDSVIVLALPGSSDRPDADGVLPAPFTHEQLLAEIEAAIARRRGVNATAPR